MTINQNNNTVFANNLYFITCRIYTRNIMEHISHIETTGKGTVLNKINKFASFLAK